MADGGRSNTDIAKRLEALMAALGMKQVEFSSLIGISQPALNNYLKALRRPDIDVAIAIQSRIGVSEHALCIRLGIPYDNGQHRMAI